MAKDKVIICKISRGKNQDRITLPRGLNSDYVAVKPIKVNNVFDSKKRFYK
jgi:hypothetical protein